MPPQSPTSVKRAPRRLAERLMRFATLAVVLGVAVFCLGAIARDASIPPGMAFVAMLTGTLSVLFGCFVSAALLAGSTATRHRFASWITALAAAAFLLLVLPDLGK